MGYDQEIQELKRKVKSLSEQESLSYLSRLTILRMRNGEIFPAIRIGSYWFEVVSTEKLFEPSDRYKIPSGTMGRLKINNGREFYFFESEKDFENLKDDIQDYVYESVIGNYANFNIPSSISGYHSDLWGDEEEGVEEPGWYFYIDNYYGGDNQGPYTTEEKCLEAYNHAEIEVMRDSVPDEFDIDYMQDIFNAETAHDYWKHPGIKINYDKYDDESDRNDYNEKFQDWIDYDFKNSLEDGLWLVPAVYPPFSEKPEWIDFYKN